MEPNTDITANTDDRSGTGSLTTIAIKTINPPLEGDDTVTNGKLRAIGTGVAGSPPWPVTVQVTYNYLGTPIASTNLGTYFSPVPPDSIVLTGPNIYSAYFDWNISTTYSLADFTVQGASGSVVSPIGPMIGEEDGEEE